MKILLLILLLVTCSLAQAQDKPLNEAEKAKERTYWRQHWHEKVKVEVIKMDANFATLRVTNELPYNISKYSISLKWYDAASRLILKPYKQEGKMRFPSNALEGYMKANTTQETFAPKEPGAVSLKVSMTYVELPKIGMKQDSQ